MSQALNCQSSLTVNKYCKLCVQLRQLHTHRVLLLLSCSKSAFHCLRHSSSLADATCKLRTGAASEVLKLPKYNALLRQSPVTGNSELWKRYLRPTAAARQVFPRSMILAFVCCVQPGCHLPANLLSAHAKTLHLKECHTAQEHLAVMVTLHK